MSKKVMVNGEEMELEESKAEEIVSHFTQESLAEKLAAYYEAKTELEVAKDAVERLGRELKELGKGEPSIMGGDYACFFTTVSGRVTTDWPRFLKEFVEVKIGKLKEGDLTPFISKADDHIKMEVKKIR